MRRIHNMIHYVLGFFLLISQNIIIGKTAITNAGEGWIGHATIAFCLAKFSSLKNNIPFFYRPFNYSDIFSIDLNEKLVDFNQYQHKIRIKDEKEIISNLDKENVLFEVPINMQIDFIHPLWINEIKSDLKLKEGPRLEKIINQLPKDRISVAVHIRKGTGGAQQYDGVQSSLQYFTFDRSKVSYIQGVSDPYNYGSNFYTNKLFPIKELPNKSFGLVDKHSGWDTKFPPDQYYIDQIKKISNELKIKLLFVQIFTDDKNPESLVKRIEQAVSNPDIIFHYEDNRRYSYKERAAQDIYNMSRFDILIRSQSYFGRVVEIVGNHKVIIYPLHAIWEHNKLIMNKILLHGSISELGC